MKLAIIAIGPPGSGKTTILLPLAQKYDLAYINRDDIRQEMLGDARDQTENTKVWEEANRRTIFALQRGQGVVLDSTFVELQKRAQAIKLVRSNGATHIIGVVTRTPLEAMKRQNAARERIVPEDVLEEYYKKFRESPPTIDEGFDLLLPL